MTLSFEDLLSRAAEPTLQELVGRPTVRLLSRLDPSLTQPDHLREVAVGLHPAQEMLLDPTMRAELLALMPPLEARALAERLGVSDGGEPFTALQRLRIRRGSRSAEDLLAYFDLVPVESPPEPQLPDAETVLPEHALFGHQRQAAAKVLETLRREPHRVLLHMPTGSGKTRTAMHVIARGLTDSAPQLVVWLAHSEELCEQAVEEFRSAWSSLGDRGLDVYRWWGHHEIDFDDARDGLVVAGLAKAYSAVQKSVGQVGLLAGRVELIVMDEAHQAIAPTYQRILEFLSQAGIDTPLLGLTATPGRTWADIDEDERLSDFFFRQKVALEVPGYANPIDYLVEEGYLAETHFEPLYYEPGFDLTERDRQELSEQLEVPPRVLRLLAEDEQRNLRIVTRVEQMARRHRRLLIFAATVEHAQLIATVLRARGWQAAAITGKTPTNERSRIIETYRRADERPRILVNFGVLTAGFDAPQTSGAVIARPTQSLVLFSQMVGRATRGPRAGGNRSAEVVTVVDTALPGFASLAEGFRNWEDVWNPHR